MSENPQPSARNEFRKKISEVGFILFLSHLLFIMKAINILKRLDDIRLIIYLCPEGVVNIINKYYNKDQKNYKTKNHQGQMSSSSRWASLVGRSGSPKTSSSSRSMRTSRKKIGQILQTSMVIFSMQALQSWQKGSFCVFSTSSKDNFCSLKPFIEGTRLQKESQI